MEQEQAEVINNEREDNEPVNREATEQDSVDTNAAEDEANDHSETTYSEKETLEYVEKSAYDELQAKADDHYQRFLRAQADLDNFRRRTRQEQADAAKYAAGGLIEQLLPIVDNFERAIKSSEETKDFDGLVKGVDIVYRQLLKALEQEGLAHIAAVGEPFNPEFHQAVMQVESEEHDEGIVVEEVQRGYMLKDKVLRAAMVTVSK